MDEPVTLSDFFQAWELFQLPALSSALLGVVLGVMGVYIVFRRMVFLSAAVSQASALGVAVGFYTGLPPLISAVFFTVASVLPATWTRQSNGLRSDSLLGVIYLLGAGGTLAVGTRIAQDMHEIDTILLGSAVAVLPSDAYLVFAVGIILLLLHAWWWRAFTAASVDPSGAQVRALPVQTIDLVLFSSLAIAVSISTSVIGALPTFAFCVLPGIAASRIASNVPRALVLSGVLGGVAGFGGYLLAFLGQLPVGASQTLVGIALVLCAAVIRRFMRR